MRGRRADVLAAAVVAAAIVAAACGSAIQRDLFAAGRRGRWMLILLLLAVAARRAWIDRHDWRLRPKATALVGLFLGLSAVSTGWSASAWSTLGRAAAQAAVVVAIALLAGCAATRPSLARALVLGVGAAVAVVAVGSGLFWLVHPSGPFSAVQAASTEYPARFRGLEFNPNTLAMLLAVGMPIALAITLDRRTRPALRVGGLAALALLATELAVTASRGGMLAGFGACIVTALVSPLAPRVRAAAAAAVVLLAVGTAYASTIPKALPAPTASHHAAAAPRTRGIDAERVLPLEAEIGNPWWTHRSETGALQRALFNTSVRKTALVGSLHRWLERPLLGWGYGAEIHAFINRYYGFASQNPENGYVGVLLQLGIVGLILFVCVLAACWLPGVLAARRDLDGTAAAVVGAAAAGILLGVSQSYFHGPGGVVFVSFWMSLLLTSVLGLSRVPGRTVG